MTILRNLRRFDRTVNGAKYGLEIELEGSNYPREVDGWNIVRDGSLGPNGFEFVTRQAHGLRGTTARLTELSQALAASNFVNESSSACSVHVHMNVQDLSPSQIVSIITTYYILEDWLTEYAAGPDRVGNLFCLRLSDSEAPLNSLLAAFDSGRFPRMLDDDGIRSAALNLNAIARLGTLEFRAHRGVVSDPTELIPWVRALDELRSWASESNSPEGIVTMFNTLENPDDFVRMIFSDETLAELGPVTDVDRMVDGARRAQWLAFNGPFEGSSPDGSTITPRHIRYEEAGLDGGSGVRFSQSLSWVDA